MKRVKYVSLSVALATAQSANTVFETKEITADKKWPFVTGVIAKVVRASGGNLYLETGVGESVNGNLIDPSHQDTLDADKSVPASDRFTPFFLPNDGRIIKGIVKNPSLTTDGLGLVTFIFRLEDSAEVRPDSI